MRDQGLASPATTRRKSEHAPEHAPRSAEASSPTRIPLWFLVALAVGLLLIGAGKNFAAASSDAIEYRCYALGFWGGAQAIASAHLAGCSSLLGTLPAHPFTFVPHEYGPLALLIFSLPLLGPGTWYPWLFAAEMLLLIVGLALLLRRVGAPGAGHAWLFYVLLGSTATAAARFDAAPAACVLLAVLALRAERQEQAYAALAAGVLLKFFPLLLLPLFLLHSWHTRERFPLWRGPTIFGTCIAVCEGLVAFLNPMGVLYPLHFLGSRCVQVESLPATLAALWASLTGQRLTFTYAYNAMCQASSAIAVASILCLALGAGAFLFVIMLFWQQRVSLAEGALLLLAIAMLTSKVFSPQYLLWITPLAAYIYGLAHPRAFVAWSAVCLATSLCYPLSYNSLLLPALHTGSAIAVPITAGARNLLLAALVSVLLYHRFRVRGTCGTPQPPTLGGAQ